MRILFVTSFFAGLLAFHNATARYFYATGREGLLFSWLGTTHPRFQSPHAGSLTQTAIAVLAIILFTIAGADPILTVFTLPSAVATLGVIVLMAVVAAATLAFFWSRPKSRIVIICSVLAMIALCAIAVLAASHFEVLTGSTLWIVKALPALLLIAALSGVVLSHRQTRTRGVFGQNALDR
jgi:amino acid transporter